MRGRKKSPDTRAAILSCASEIFAQREFHAVLTEDIATALGIGKGTIYRYFGSKEELYFATIVDGLLGMDTAVTAALRQPAPIAVVIERLVETILNYFWRRRDFFVLLYRHESKLDPRARVEWQQRREEVVEQVRRLLEGSLPKGSLGRRNPRLAVEILFGMIRSACLYREPSDRPKELTKLITAVFLHGINSNVSSTRNGGRPHRAVATRHQHTYRGGAPRP